MTTILTRRHLIQASAAAAALPCLALAADEPIELAWEDLLPEGEGSLTMDLLRGLGIIEHGQMQSQFEQPDTTAVVTTYNGKRVRIPGYAVPLDFASTAVREFILVPYIGACIHVPPPPANQLVFATAAKPFEQTGLWDPVWAIGTFSASAVDTGLAEVGYVMTEAEVAPYSED